MRYAERFVFAFLLVAWGVNASASEDGHSLTFGVHPYCEPAKLVEDLLPIVERVDHSCGTRTTVVVSRNYEHHLEQVVSGAYDYFYMGSALYVMAAARTKVVPLAQLKVSGRGLMRGTFVLPPDSPVRSVRDLTGRTVAFADRFSTSGYFLPVHLLHEEGISLSDLGRYDCLSNHDDVALAVLMGEYDAGAVKEEVALAYEKKGLRVLAVTDEVAEYLFAAKADSDPRLVECIGNALMTIHANPEGVNHLHALKKSAAGLGPVADSDYDPLREILAESETLEEGK